MNTPGSIGALYKLYKQNGGAFDNPAVQAKFARNDYTLDAFLSDKEFWNMDLHTVNGLAEQARKAAEKRAARRFSSEI